MKFLFDTSDIQQAALEAGITDFGQLITPLTGMNNRGLTFAIDNGCFKSFNKDNWLRILDRERPHQARCEFVAIPDVVGCSHRTMALFEYYRRFYEQELRGYRLAYVLQDGQEELPLRRILPLVHYVFVGGTNAFKLGEDVKPLINLAQRKDVKVHVGRINSKERYDKFKSLGCDSCDGTGLCRFTWQRQKFAQPQFQEVLQ